MRYEVPQFIDIEDKIFGPLTFKQGIYIAGGVGASFATYYFLGKTIPEIPFLIQIVLAAPFAALGGTLAFVKVNKRPFINYLESMFFFYISSKKYIWKKKEKKVISKKNNFNENNNKNNIDGINIPKISKSKLKDIAWRLDVNS